VKIPLTKPLFGPEEQRAAAETIASGWVTQGPKVAAFEEAFAEYCGAKHAVATSNCTTALHLALLAAGVGQDDEVICPSMSFIATANAIRHCRARPVFAEVRREDFNIDPDDIERRITERTKAILPVHQLGMPAEMDAICDLAERHGLAVVEDAACAAGSAYRGRRIGKPFGQFACFSFHPRKVITMGEGGMITTDDREAADRLRLLRQHGMSVPDTVRHEARTVVIEAYVCLGYNYRMTDIQAAIGIEQLKRLDGIVAARRAIAARYNAAFGELPGVEVPLPQEGVEPNYQSYAIRLTEAAAVSRDELMRRLLRQGIATRRGVMTIHREPAYAELCRGLKLPVSEAASDGSVILPLYPQMTEQEQSQVIEAVRAALR